MFTTRTNVKEADLEATGVQSEKQGIGGGRKLTTKQILYLVLMQGVGSAIIDGAVNFAIACAMYRTTHREIRVWPLAKNTIAGDLGVTVIIQSILSTLIVGFLVRGDIRSHIIEPFPSRWPDVDPLLRGGRFRRTLARAIAFLSPTQTLTLRNGWLDMFYSLLLMALRGFFLSVIYFIIFWPIAIAIIAPLYGGIDMRGTWIPEIITGTFGAVLGLFQTPLIAALVLGTHIPVPPLSTPTPTPQMSAVSSSPLSTPPSLPTSLRSPSTQIRSQPVGRPSCRPKIQTTTPIEKSLTPSGSQPSSPSLTPQPSLSQQPVPPPLKRPASAHRSLLLLAKDRRRDRSKRDSATSLMRDPQRSSGSWSGAFRGFDEAILDEQSRY